MVLMVMVAVVVGGCGKDGVVGSSRSSCYSSSSRGSGSGGGWMIVVVKAVVLVPCVLETEASVQRVSYYLVPTAM